MDIDETLPRKTSGPLLALQLEDLDRLSREELKERVVQLEAETRRTKNRLEGASSFRSVADALFKT